MNPDIQPNQNFQPSQPSQPPVTQNGPQIPNSMLETGPSAQYSGDRDNKTKKILIVLGAIVGIFIIIVVATLIFSGGAKDDKAEEQQAVTNQEFIREPSSIDVENTKNSISDDVSNLNSNDDFPSENLSDENLGL